VAVFAKYYLQEKMMDMDIVIESIRVCLSGNEV